ncbi:MAG: EF-P lysine aminoacylase GenX [Gammaproteobacteria bacterium]|nr:EF-P lysine aminoacylase GenX [Gammaproteobacteria bacterium]
MSNVSPIKGNDWKASVSYRTLKLRAETLKSIRHFFEKQSVLEVDTPVLSCSTVPDPFIQSFQTQYTPLTQALPEGREAETFFLHTSPEFPMKRLLATGSGSIYQIAKVFRQGEAGHKHNPEFTLLEWYRVGWDHHQLMTEVSQLLTQLLRPFIDLAEPVFVTYEATFQKTLGINPHTASQSELVACAEAAGLSNVLAETEHRDRFLELLFSHVIEPDLGMETEKPQLCFLYNYPASQASLAKTAMYNDQLIAERFEIFINGMELGNGFNELTDASEQRYRFEADNQTRNTMGLDEIPMDEHFLEAVASLPECAGVAVGIDRLLMLMDQSDHIDEVIAFPFERA